MILATGWLIFSPNGAVGRHGPENHQEGSFQVPSLPDLSTHLVTNNLFTWLSVSGNDRIAKDQARSSWQECAFSFFLELDQGVLDS